MGRAEEEHVDAGEPTVWDGATGADQGRVDRDGYPVGEHHGEIGEEVAVGEDGLDEGEELDADRWLNREPNCWEKIVREAQPRKTVTIGVNLTVYAVQDPQSLIYRGAAACAK